MRRAHQGGDRLHRVAQHRAAEVHPVEVGVAVEVVVDERPREAAVDRDHLGTGGRGPVQPLGGGHLLGREIVHRVRAVVAEEEPGRQQHRGDDERGTGQPPPRRPGAREEQRGARDRHERQGEQERPEDDLAAVTIPGHHRNRGHAQQGDPVPGPAVRLAAVPPVTPEAGQCHDANGRAEQARAPLHNDLIGRHLRAADDVRGTVGPQRAEPGEHLIVVRLEPGQPAVVDPADRDRQRQQRQQEPRPQVPEHREHGQRDDHHDGGELVAGGDRRHERHQGGHQDQPRRSRHIRTLGGKRGLRPIRPGAPGHPVPQRALGRLLPPQPIAGPAPQRAAAQPARRCAPARPAR